MDTYTHTIEDIEEKKKREICQSNAVLDTQFTLTYKFIGRLYKHSINIT